MAMLSTQQSAPRLIHWMKHIILKFVFVGGWIWDKVFEKQAKCGAGEVHAGDSLWMCGAFFILVSIKKLANCIKPKCSRLTNHCMSIGRVNQRGRIQDQHGATVLPGSGYRGWMTMDGIFQSTGRSVKHLWREDALAFTQAD